MRNPFEYRPEPEQQERVEDVKTRAPHETAAVLRGFRQGASTARLCAELGMSKQQLIHEMNLAIDEEIEAHRIGVSIHDDGLPEDAFERAQYLRMYG